MDDRELEARLSKHVHDRFDSAPVPGRLAATVRHRMTTAPTANVGFSLGRRGLQLGWFTTAAIVVSVGAFLLFRNGLGPAGPGATPVLTPVPTLHVIAERWFVVLPAGGTSPSAADREAAVQVEMDRLARLGLKSSSSEAPGSILVTLEQEGLPNDAIIRILSATGDVEFVPLPDSAEGTALKPGQPIPTNLPALFGWDGIESVAQGANQDGIPTLDFTLTPAARQAFGDYTTNHSREYVAIVIDGRIALLPVINEPIPGGEIAVSSGGAPGSAEQAQFDEELAILVGGKLPASWEGADVKQVLTQQAAIEAARVARHPASSDVAGADLDILQAEGSWQPVWRVSFADGAVLTLDAVTGAWLSTGISSARLPYSA